MIICLLFSENDDKQKMKTSATLNLKQKKKQSFNIYEMKQKKNAI